MRRRPEALLPLVELTPSHWDDEPIQRSRAMLAGLAGVDGISLEFVARQREVRFYLRPATQLGLDAAVGQFRAAYPQARLRLLYLEERPYLDPAWRAPGEISAAVRLGLARDSAYPLFTGVRSNDPLPGVLAAASGVGPSERIVGQLVLTPARQGWREHLQVMAEEHQQHRRREAHTGTTGSIMPLVGLFGMGAVGLQGYEWYEQGRTELVAGLAVGSLVLGPMALALAVRFLSGLVPPSPDLLDEKLESPAFATDLRLLAIGPKEAGRGRLSSLVERVASSYQAFDHPLGNSLRAQVWRGEPRRPVVSGGIVAKPNILNAAECAVLWHLPNTSTGLSTRTETTAHHLLPSDEDVSRGCRVGAALHQEQRVAAFMPRGLLFRNQLIVAKTRRGKSTLLVHIASHLMEALATGRERLLLVVVDPHQDLAEATLGLVPAELTRRTAYLNLADRQRPVGINLLDVTLFPDRDRTAENVVTMMHRLWPDNWGPRMEGALRASVLSLHHANQARQRAEQYTLLDVVPILSNADFREEVLKQVPDRTLWAWWRDNYDNMNSTLRQQTANPVTTKVGRFLVTEASRLVLGQAVSTFDPRPLLKEGGVLVVNSAVGLLGEGAASLVGATVLNLLGLLVEEQVTLPASQRSKLVALVDESSTLGAADYPRMLSELGKYGASFVLVTQSLAKLDAIDEALRPTLFSNIDGLTVFQVSAQDARYLAPELGGDLDVADLTALDDFECYARWWAEGRRLPTFSLRLDPPPSTSGERLREVVEQSAERYGRPRAVVAAEIEAALAKVDAPSKTQNGAVEASPPRKEQSQEDDAPELGVGNKPQPARNQHRDQVSA